MPIEYFEKLGYVENDVLDVDITVRNGAENRNESSLSVVETLQDVEYSIDHTSVYDKEDDNGVIIPYDTFIPIDNMLYIGKELYYAINGKIAEQDGKRFKIDIKTGKIKPPAESIHQSNQNYAKWV